MRFIHGVILAGVVVVLVNAVFITFAVQGADEIEPSYHSEPR